MGSSAAEDRADLLAERAEQGEACGEIPDFGERVACRRDARVVPAGPGRRNAVAVIVESEHEVKHGAEHGAERRLLPTFQVDAALTGAGRGLSAFVEAHELSEHYGVNAGVGWRERSGTPGCWRRAECWSPV